MVWEATAGPIVTQMRTHLASSPTWQALVGAANASARIHFPLIDLSGKDVPREPVPACLFTRTQIGRSRWATDTGGLIKGAFELLFYVPALAGLGVSVAFGVGSLEVTVESIVAEIIAQRAGIPFSGESTIDPATDPTNAQAAVTVDGQPCAYRTCKAVLPYGYTT